MTTLFLDTETFCEVPIERGTYAYAAKAEVMLVAYAEGRGPVLVEPFDRAALQLRIDRADTIVLHNSFFDRTVLHFCGVNVPVHKIDDTMVIALAHSLPGGLDKLCDVLKIPFDKAKSKEGKRLINLFCKPRPKKQKLRRATEETHPVDWAAFVDYARMDVVSMRECYLRMPRWNSTIGEHKLWQLDQKINDRGVKIDLDLARSALRAAASAQDVLSARAGAMTDGAVGSFRQRDKFKEYLQDSQGLHMADMKKGTVAALLKENISDDIREMLQIRQQASSTSPAKYTVLVNSTSEHDGRLRGTLQFCGASRTGRWGGRMFQPQNLPRPTLPQATIELGIAAMKAAVEDLIFANIMELCASAVRGAIVPDVNKKMVVSDLKNIEGRVLAWLAGEDWKVDAFAEFDKGVGHDIYILAYARAFGIKPEDVDKHMRQIGKVMELALGYGGAVGAFTTMGAQYGVSLPEDEVVTLVRAWRRAHPKITEFWYDIEWACRRALRNPGELFKVGLIEIDRQDHNGMKWLRVRLPSGRYLCYPNADENESGQLVYDGVNQYTKQWEEIDTYGPKVVENIVQAVSRDILARGMRAAENANYEVCLHIHDELITETDDTDDFTAEHLSDLMAAPLPWTLGLPLAAEGFSCHRYRKD